MGTLLPKSVKCLQTFEEGLPRGDNLDPGQSAYSGPCLGVDHHNKLSSTVPPHRRLLENDDSPPYQVRRIP